MQATKLNHAKPRGKSPWCLNTAARNWRHSNSTRPYEPFVFKRVCFVLSHVPSPSRKGGAFNFFGWEPSSLKFLTILHGWPMRFGSIRFFDSTRAEAIRPIRFDQLARLRGHNDGSLQKQHAPRCVFPAPKMHLDERLIFKAADRRSMLPDAFSRLRKMHLDERWILKAAPRRSMLPDARCVFPAPKNAFGQVVGSQGSS